MIDGPLREAATGGVENILIFISDSLRYDSLPDAVRARGVTAKTILAAPWTASSVPSMMTGQYPSTHCVWMFEDRLAERPPLLSEPDDWTAGLDSEKHWLDFEPQNKPPIRMLGLDGEQRLSETKSPFVHVVHDLGPHAPYGFENDEYNTAEYFEEYDDPVELKRLYEDDAEKSGQYFLDVLEQLSDRGILSETLCVFTSDHGELLGEGSRLGGKWGYSSPLCPELLEVPTVFCGAGLPEDEEHGHLLSGVDPAPTCLSAVGRSPGRVDGVDHWATTPDPDRMVRADVWQRYEAFDREWPVYVASGLWDESGGWVFHRRSRALRASYYLYDVFVGDYAPPARHTAGVGDVLSGIKFWSGTWRKFGEPGCTKGTARERLAEKFTRSGSVIRMNDEQRGRLEDLGYV
jgi:arylsulfatase A-like enzyme